MRRRCGSSSMPSVRSLAALTATSPRNRRDAFTRSAALPATSSLVAAVPLARSPCPPAHSLARRFGRRLPSSLRSSVQTPPRQLARSPCPPAHSLARRFGRRLPSSLRSSVQTPPRQLARSPCPLHLTLWARGLHSAA